MDQTHFNEAGQRLLGWDRVLLLAHDRPDGDALGSLAAMRSVLAAMGKHPTACVYDFIPPRYGFIGQGDVFSLFPSGAPADVDAQFDGILILDTCSWSQLEPVAAYLRATRLPKLIVDHHSTRDELQGASSEAFYLIDSTASAACTLLFEWISAMGWTVPETAAVALFSGIATDTGWFRFPSTDPRTLQAAGALIGQGLRPDIMYARLMDAYSVSRVKLLAGALRTLELHAGGGVAAMQIRPEMFVEAGASAADTEDIVNEPLKAREIVASVLMIDMNDGRIRVNFRSKSPEVVGYELDVAAVAAQFGGGGHRRAAGARIAGPLDQVAPRVMKAMNAAIASAKAGPAHPGG